MFGFLERKNKQQKILCIEGDQKDTWKLKEWFANVELMECRRRLARRDKGQGVKSFIPRDFVAGLRLTESTDCPISSPVRKR